MSVSRDGTRVWRSPDGKPLDCAEKIRVLEENLGEIRELCAEALEDAVVMGGDAAQLRAVLKELVDELEDPFARKS